MERDQSSRWTANHQVRDTEVMTTIDHVIGILESSSKTWTYIQNIVWIYSSDMFSYSLDVYQSAS